MRTAELLGGTRILSPNPATSWDWVLLVRQGLPSACATELANQLGRTDTDVANALGISRGTLAKRRRVGRLTIRESVTLLRLARILERTLSVFEAVEPSVNWLNERHIELGGVTPLSLLDTEFGAEQVVRVLRNIEYGLPV